MSVYLSRGSAIFPFCGAQTWTRWLNSTPPLSIFQLTTKRPLAGSRHPSSLWLMLMFQLDRLNDRSSAARPTRRFESRKWDSAHARVTPAVFRSSQFLRDLLWCPRLPAWLQVGLGVSNSFPNFVPNPHQCIACRQQHVGNKSFGVFNTSRRYFL